MLDKKATRRPILLNANGEPMVRNHMAYERRGNLRYEYMLWDAWTEPYGFLPRDLAAQCLMTYCLGAASVLETRDYGVRYVGDPTVRYNLAGLLLSWCAVYGVKPEQAVRYWPAIDKQRKLLGLTDEADLPRWVRYPDDNTKLM